MTAGTDRAWLLALVLVAVCTGVAGPAGASDTVGIVQYEPEVLELAPGETAEVALELSAGGPASATVGVDRANATLTYDPAALTVTGVEHGPWLTGTGSSDALADDADAATLVTTTDIDESAGEVRVSQVRTPSGAGVLGSDVFLELTVSVADDARPSNYTLGYAETELRMVNDHYQPTFEHEGLVSVTDDTTSGPGAVDDAPGEFALGVATLLAIGVVALLVFGRRS